MFKAFRFFLTLLFPPLILALIGAWWLVSYLDTPLKLKQEHDLFQLNAGMGLSAVADKAAAEGLLEYPAALKIYARLQPEQALLRTGEYRLESGMTIREWLSKMQRGEVVSYQITLVEGWTLAQVIALLNANDKLQPVTNKNASDKTDLRADEGLWAQLGLQAPEVVFPEGWFFPDTYQFHRGENAVQLLRRAHERMQQILDEEWAARAPDLPYKNRYDALIMASIIEKETGLASEREQIAGVFVRRLQKKMRLQTDPTVIYGMGDSYKGNLRSADLRNANNPYNTYQHFQLPPTPIALPGREAIHAALHPAEGSALYFVARGDGSHQFSATLAEHQAAVRKYQITQRRQSYRSAPEANK
ncbi:endolytic transglycosylase MltG [Spongiibacter sp. KMU-158]|uniref:Endolytic murein transglycosylase n=1 Tax=Spongiibacter pelagi TaxID=2760804 RepID=A0A927C4M3_9GAMM|nr:endolytic transglycosylase MltG [Spongiibacter pelagi]MBD2859671.1 endolytic transglycosylase MltG [Spongiibacter pelagi]